jgi:hypothetical protein
MEIAKEQFPIERKVQRLTEQNLQELLAVNIERVIIHKKIKLDNKSKNECW